MDKLAINVPKRGSHEAWKPVLNHLDRDPVASNFIWRSHQKLWVQVLDIVSISILKPYSQSERTLPTLEEMLRACVIDFGNGWFNIMPLSRVSYNNRYHSSIKAAPFEHFRSQVSFYPCVGPLLDNFKLTSPELVYARKQTEGSSNTNK
ncbi:putative reverse transcriptase domain-containing protein [Tanacetum coccineum]